MPAVSGRRLWIAALLCLSALGCRAAPDFGGERPSLDARYAAAWVTDAADHEGNFDLAPYDAITAWLARVAAEPAHVTIDA